MLWRLQLETVLEDPTNFSLTWSEHETLKLESQNERRSNLKINVPIMKRYVLMTDYN